MELDISPTIIEKRQGISSLQLQTLWEYRELLYFLIWRDVKVRYKQTALGVFWVILQPLINMVIFTLLFGVLFKVPSGDAPYPIFVYAALLPWNYFSGSLARASTSLVGSSNLITKVYFPRLIIPLAAVLSGLVDFIVSFIVYIGLMLVYKVPLTVTMFLLPLFLILAILIALGFSLWLSAFNVKYRDVNYLIPFIIQVWMYITPVIYSLTSIPERFRFLLILNPMTGVIEGFRWILLGNQMVGLQPAPLYLAAVAVTLVVLVGGVYYFRNTERFFADVI